MGKLLLVGVAVCIALSAGNVPSALGAETHVFDPELSLTGDCSVVPPDTSPDPGCPGGSHPPKPFLSPRGITTDFYGNIYVPSYGDEAKNGKEGRIDIFNPEGFFIGSLAEPEGPKDLAVDSKGNLYVYSFHLGPGVGTLHRYSPTAPYEPEAGKIEYEASPVVVGPGGSANSIAISPSNDHLFFKNGNAIIEFSSAAEGNTALTEIGVGVLGKGVVANGVGLAVDEEHNLVYAGDNPEGVAGAVRIFELPAPHALLGTIEGSEVPVGVLTSQPALAVDEASGRFFIFDGSSNKKVYEFEFDKGTKKASYLSTLQLNGKDGGFAPIPGSEISVDNGPFSPNSGFNPDLKGGYLYVPSEGSLGQSLAFAPSDEGPPVVEDASFANVTHEDAELLATVNPESLETHYIFEITTQGSFEEEGFASAWIAGEGDISAGKIGVKVSTAATSLAAETAYRFRVIAENEKGEEGAEGSFTTYPASLVSSCPNDGTRIGLAALLPDCRAYELVTPPDTNARAPRGIGKTAGIYFTTREASPDGNRVSFITEGGTLPGQEGTGSLSGDAYLSARSENGWGTTAAGPNGVEAVSPLVGSTSPDQRYSFWNSNPEGSTALEGKSTGYVRYPDGHSELIGRGGLGTDPGAEGRLISENGDHIIFSSPNVGAHTAVQLEENAPPDGTAAVYDRTADEVTHVVSFLPDNATPTAGQDALYIGASLDGEGVAFRIGKTLYLRHANEETYEVGENVTFAGIAEGGGRIFYVKAGDLFAFDVEGGTIPFTSSGDVTVVNVSADGTTAYFVSPSVLAGGPNPNGAEPEGGNENLYLSQEGAISFVGMVTQRDVEGEKGETEQVEGLGLWTEAVGLSGSTAGRLSIDPSRVTPDGDVLLFESRANLTGYDSEGFAQIYRYDSAGSLECLSCNPTQAPATGDASLQSILQVLGGPEPFNSFAFVENLQLDGRRAFFQSAEPLVEGDTDGLQDVYEWEGNGVGTCTRPQGCVYLISSGHSSRVDYLYAISDDGADVFFRSSDLLLGLDTDSTPSIYDARVEGGFLEPIEETCQGEGCRPGLTPAPPLSPPESRIHEPETEPTPKKRCPKGKHKVKKNGKVRCVKKKSGKHRGHKAGSNRRAGK